MKRTKTLGGGADQKCAMLGAGGRAGRGQAPKTKRGAVMALKRPRNKHQKDTKRVQEGHQKLENPKAPKATHRTTPSPQPLKI